MSEVNRIKVIIDEDVYELSSPESPEYIQNVAGYIDNKIKEIYSVKSEGAINARLRTLFISLNIADDLFKEKQEVKNLNEKLVNLNRMAGKSSNEISKLKEDNALLKERIQSLQQELQEARNELEEYIEAFELEEQLKASKVARLKR